MNAKPLDNEVIGTENSAHGFTEGADTTPEVGFKDPERKISREQRRHMEKIDKEANDNFTILAEKLAQYILAEDDRDDIQDYADMLNKKWLFVCDRLILIKEARTLFTNYAKKAIDHAVGERKEMPNAVIRRTDDKKFGWADRFKILFGGVVNVQTEIETDSKVLVITRQVVIISVK